MSDFCVCGHGYYNHPAKRDENGDWMEPCEYCNCKALRFENKK